MIEEEILEVEQEIRGLSALEQESKALEEADAKAVEAAREKRQLRKKKAIFLLPLQASAFFSIKDSKKKPLQMPL